MGHININYQGKYCEDINVTTKQNPHKHLNHVTKQENSKKEVKTEYNPETTFTDVKRGPSELTE